MLKFVRGGIYHIYNAGCGRQSVFFQERNYHYFIRKMMYHIRPYAEIIAYDLKANEIHLLIQVKHLSLYIPERDRMRTLAESIGLMLRSYAQAINKQEKRKGVLWQGPTKADLYTIAGIEGEERPQERKEVTITTEKPVRTTAVKPRTKNLLKSKKTRGRSLWKSIWKNFKFTKQGRKNLLSFSIKVKVLFSVFRLQFEIGGLNST